MAEKSYEELEAEVERARVARYAEAQCVMVGGRLATTAYDAALSSADAPTEQTKGGE